MKAILRISLAVLAAVTMASCCGNSNELKFSAKEYAEKKTSRLNDAVGLDKKQEKKVYNLYLQQGKVIAKKMKECKKEECNAKQPQCKQECNKPECDKAGKPACDKAKCAECPKAGECKKECAKAGECKKECAKLKQIKAECDKTKCDKAGKPACNKAKCAECPKANDCKKECAKAGACKKECAKAGECKKECAKLNQIKAECDKTKHMKSHHPRRPFFTPEEKKAFVGELNSILTPEQSEKLKSRHATRPACPNIPAQEEGAAPAAK